MYPLQDKSTTLSAVDTTGDVYALPTGVDILSIEIESSVPVRYRLGNADMVIGDLTTSDATIGSRSPGHSGIPKDPLDTHIAIKTLSGTSDVYIVGWR